MKILTAIAATIMLATSVLAADEPRDLTAAREQYKSQQLTIHTKYKQDLERMLATHRTRKDDKSIVQVNAELVLVQQRIDELSVKVIEGFGFGPFRLGAKRDELIAALGKPDTDPRSTWLKWENKGVNCLINDDAIGATELRFTSGFKGQVSDGIRIGSTESDVIKSLGQPDKVVDDGRFKRLQYPQRGILAIISSGKLSEFVISR